MAPIDLLLDLSRNDGIKVVLDAVASWADSLIPPGATEVPNDVLQHVKGQRDRWYHADIEKWPPQRHWEELIGNFHRRMRSKTPIQGVSPPPLRRTTHKYDEAELMRRAHMLAESTRGLSITQALDFFEELVVQWSLNCDEEWIDQQHSGYVFHLLAQLTEH